MAGMAFNSTAGDVAAYGAAGARTVPFGRHTPVVCHGVSSTAAVDVVAHGREPFAASGRASCRHGVRRVRQQRTGARCAFTRRPVHRRQGRAVRPYG